MAIDIRRKVWDETYRQNNKEKIKESAKRYRDTHKQKIREINNNYVKTRYKKDINFKLRFRLRVRLHKALTRNQKTGSTIQNLGCSIQELKEYLEKQFKPGMTWDNWSMNGWHIDHIKPLDSFDMSDPEQIKTACHYSNLQPLWAEDNRHKSNKPV
jgi:hypothetical protein